LTAARPPVAPGGTQLELHAPGESRLFDQRHWVASSITNQALARTRHIARELAETRGWNPRIVIETRRALAVVLADHHSGDLIAFSRLSPALRSQDLSVTRTAEILALAGLLSDDRISSFASLKNKRLALLPHRWPPTSSTGYPLEPRAAPEAVPATNTPCG
jgi:hypothetical protein